MASAHYFVCSRREQIPDAVQPIEVFGLHQDRAQARHRFAIALHRSQIRLPKTHRQLRYRQMQIVLGCRLEYLAAQDRSLAHAPRFWRKYDDVQFGFKRGHKPFIRTYFLG